MTIAASIARDIVNHVREHVTRRCETCVFWKGTKSWWSPKYWKGCTLSGKDTSPVFSCRNYKAEEEGNGS